jgi:hypothetical protein
MLRKNSHICVAQHTLPPPPEFHALYAAFIHRDLRDFDPEIFPLRCRSGSLQEHQTFDISASFHISNGVCKEEKGGCDMEFFLSVLGMVMIIEGLPYAGFPAKMKEMMAKIMELPESSLQVFGLVLMVLGILLVWLGKG